MALTTEDYLVELQGLLPVGPAWPRDPDSELTLRLAADAEEFARVDARIDDLVNESDPRSASEMLADWERVVGLPDGCTGPLSGLAARRAAVIGRLTAEGGQSQPYYIALAATLGFEITISEHEVHTCDSDCDEPINDLTWRFVWDVNVAEAVTVRESTCMDGCETPLANWGNELLECALSRLKPAHTKVRFIYSV